MAQTRTQPDAWPVDGVARVLEDRMNMDPEDAQATAETLEGLFQGERVVEDTELESQERSLLWTLMLEGLVTVETQVRPRPEDGRPWRYFYWHLVPPERLGREREPAQKAERTVYDKLPAEAWQRTPAGGAAPAAA